MPLDQQRMVEMCDELLDRAKDNRERIGYKGQFAQVAIVFGPQLEKSVLPLQWENEKQKQLIMAALSASARELRVPMIALIIDVRWCGSDKFADYYHIEKPDDTPEGLERFQTEYYKIVNGIYGGAIELLPTELWHEAIMVAAKGPLLEPYMLSAQYREGKNNTIEWLQTGKEKDEGWIVMLPDWWDQTTPQ